MAPNRFFVYEGATLRAAQSTLDLALRYANESTSVYRIAQGVNGKWDFFPVRINSPHFVQKGRYQSPEKALRSMDKFFASIRN